MTTKFTPGPWRVNDPCYGDTGARHGISSNAGRWVDLAHVYCSCRAKEKEADANAALIASAPDLYRACEALLRAHSAICEDDESGEDDDCKAARAALKRARGEE